MTASAGYSFRLRFRLTRTHIGSDEVALDLGASVGLPPGKVVMKPVKPELTIADSDEFAVVGSDFPSAEAARTAANAWQDELQIAFASAKIGADFGVRFAGGSTLSAHAIRAAEEASGRPVRNERLGADVFLSDAAPLYFAFSATGHANVVIDQLLGLLLATHLRAPAVDETQRAAFAVYSAAFTLQDPDARFLTLMTAVEVLIDPKPRAPEVIKHVDSLIRATQASGLGASDKTSVTGSLRWLRKQSIGRAGRDLAATLGDRTYAELNAEDFFRACYKIRSKLVHGQVPLPERDDVSLLAAHLERFVGDLLSGGLAVALPAFAVEGPQRERWDEATSTVAPAS